MLKEEEEEEEEEKEEKETCRGGEGGRRRIEDVLRGFGAWEARGRRRDAWTSVRRLGRAAAEEAEHRHAACGNREDRPCVLHSPRAPVALSRGGRVPWSRGRVAPYDGGHTTAADRCADVRSGRRRKS